MAETRAKAAKRRTDGKTASKEALPADIHAELVESLFGTVGSFASGLMGGMLVPAIAWIRTEDPIFLACTAVMILLAAYRVIVHLDHQRASPQVRRRLAVQFEKRYAFGAIGFMLAVGVTASLLLVLRHDQVSSLYGLVITLGCAGALAGRNAGRPHIVNGQVWGLCGPVALTLLFAYETWYWGLAAILGLILSSVKSTTRFLNSIIVSALLNGRDAERQRSQFSTALDSMSHGLCMADADGVITVVNQRLEEMFNLPPGADALTNDELAERMAESGGMSPTAKQTFLDNWRAHVASRDSSVFTAAIGGRIFDFRCEPEERGGFVVVAEDVTAARLASREVERMAHFDTLTGLPNRSQFYGYLSRQLEVPQKNGGMLALLSVDLDQFKEINDTRGHPTGDALLRLVAKRLRQAVKGADMVARFGGDEFQVLIKVRDEAGARAAARRIIDELSRAYMLEGQVMTIGASVGIAFAPKDALDADELLRCADMALYRAKGDGRGVARSFTPEMETALRRKREIEEILREALAQDRLELHYQPVVDSRTSEIVACEALVRLPHPSGGMVSPAEFIPVAEETGQVVKLGDWVLRRACRDAVAWPAHIRVAVNFSPKQFVLGRDVVADIQDALDDAGLPPHRLEVEITESTIMEAKDSLQQLSEISRLGVKISLDDFGTGYSSLSYLRQFPVDKIKIDQSFARDIESQASQAVIRSVSVLAGLLEVDLVIEGIETKSQLDVLKSWNVHLVQGYYYSRPRPIAQLLPLLERPAPFKNPGLKVA